MPELFPFNVVRFAEAIGGGDISGKIAPPYDVLDAGPKASLLEKDEHNIVAIDLPVTPPKTVGPDAAYAAAGELYRRWLRDGVLVREDQPCVVVYEQQYGPPEVDPPKVAPPKVDPPEIGPRIKRRGLFANLGVEEFNRPGGGIFRHEMTIAGGIGDRTKLMEATRAQLSPIFGMYPDPRPRPRPDPRPRPGTGHRTVGTMLDDICASRDADFHGQTDRDGVTHRGWIVRDPATLTTLREFFRTTDVFIADGHHRYTTALQFARDHPELPGAGRCLFVLVAAEDPGMVVLPTHRVVGGLEKFAFDDLLAAIESDGRFAVRRGDFEDVQLSSARCQLYNPASPDDRHGVWLRGEAWNAATAATGEAAGEAAQVELPDGPRAKLDVSVVHDWLIDQVVRPRFGGDQVWFKYTPDVDEMRGWAGRGSPMTDGRFGIVMNPTPLAEVMAVSLAGEVMPAKSTYFFPKLATGLVINPLE